MTEEQIKAKQGELTAEFNTLRETANQLQAKMNEITTRQVEIQGAMKLLEDLRGGSSPKEE